MIDVKTFTAMGNELKEKFTLLEAQMKNIQETMRAEAQKTLDTVFKDFFECVPEIVAITWTQYTPYFNDGDECRFGVNDFWFIPQVTEEDWKNGFAEEYSISTYNDDPFMYLRENYSIDISMERGKEIREICRSVKTILNRINNETFLYLWGDHAEVIVTKNGIKSDEWDHE